MPDLSLWLGLNCSQVLAQEFKITALATLSNVYGVLVSTEELYKLKMAPSW